MRQIKEGDTFRAPLGRFRILTHDRERGICTLQKLDGFLDRMKLYMVPAKEVEYYLNGGDKND